MTKELGRLSKRLLSQTETAALLGCDRGSVRDLLDGGELKGFKRKGRWVWCFAYSVEGLLKDGRVTNA